MNAYPGIMAGVVLAALLPGATAVGQQHAFPTKPVRLVVAFPPGGTPDTLARLIGPKLIDTFRQVGKTADSSGSRLFPSPHPAPRARRGGESPQFPHCR